MYIHWCGGAVAVDSDSGPALVVVWADPGVTTGWCVLRVPIARLLSLGQVGSRRWLWWRVGQFRTSGTSESVDSFLALGRAAWEKAGEEDVVVLGCEGFSLGMLSRDKALLEPVRFLAVLEDRMRAAGGDVAIEVQMPGERNVITDARLRLWDLWVPGPDHPRDALKHGLAFFRRFEQQPLLRKRLGWEG
jgi:hypothetical protein